MRRFWAVLLPLIFLLFSCAPSKKKSFYLFELESRKIYARGKTKLIFPPFEGDIDGILLLLPEKGQACINLNNNPLCFSSPSARPVKGRTVLKRLRGNFTLILLQQSPLYRGTLQKGQRLDLGDKEAKLYTVLFRKKGNDLYSLDFEILHGTFRAREKGEYLILEGKGIEGWKREMEDLLKSSYIKIGSTTYQVLQALPPSKRSFKYRFERNWRLSFYTIVLNLPPEFGIHPWFGDGVRFKIMARINGGRWKTIFFEKIKAGIKYWDIKIPESTQELVFITEKGSDLFGDGAFWSRLFAYKKGKGEVIVLISMDTVRARSLSLYGNSRKTTPFLDSWAPSEARIYMKAYTPHPWTLAAHRAMFFSTYYWEKPETSFVEKLQEKGYYTAAFTGGGLVAGEYGFARGFVTYYEYVNDIFDPNSSALLFYRVKEFIDGHPGRRLFLFLHTYQAHSPYYPPDWAAVFGQKGRLDINSAKGGPSGSYSPLPDEIKKRALALYEEEIYTIDQRLLKPLVKYLEKKGLYSNSHLIILSDHGEQFYEHGCWEHGYSLYQEETRVPLIVKSSKFGRGREEKPFSLINIPWLVSSIAGFTPHPSWKEPSSRIYMSTTPGSSVFFFPLIKAVISNDLKLIENERLNKERFRTPPERPRFEFYDLSVDPLEKHNVFLKRNLEARKLKALLRKFSLAGEKKGRLSEEEKQRLRSLGYIE